MRAGSIECRMLVMEVLEGSKPLSLRKPTSYRGLIIYRQTQISTTHLSESENIINEKQHILALRITEMFCNCQTCEPNTSTGTRELIHLPIHQRTLAFQLQPTNLIPDHQWFFQAVLLKHHL